MYSLFYVDSYQSLQLLEELKTITFAELDGMC